MEDNHSFFQLNRSKKRRIVRLVAIIFLSALIISIGLNLIKRQHIKALREKEAQALPDKALLLSKVESNPIYWTRRYSAKIEPQYWIKVSSEITGTVNEINVDIGDLVKKNQILIGLNQTNADLKMNEAKARWESVAAEEKEYQRKKENRKTLAEEGVIDTDGYQELLSQVDRARAQTDLAKSGLDQAEYYLSQHQIRAPFDGSISERLVDLGETIQPSHALLRMVSLPPYYLRFGVSDVDLAKINIGDEAHLSSSLFDHDIKAHITRIASASDRETGLFEVELELQKTINTLRPGMICEIKFKKKLRDGLIIQTDFMLSRNDHFFVYRLGGTQDIQKGEWIEVSVRMIGDQITEIQKGVSVGDQLLFPKNAPIPPAEL